MKYLVFSIILSTVFVLTIKGDDIPDKIKWKKYTGDKSLLTEKAKSAIEKYNGMKNETFEFVKVLRMKQATIKNETHVGISILAKKCKIMTTEEKEKKDIKQIFKLRKNVCIAKIIYAKYLNGISGENITVGDLDSLKKHIKSKQNKNDNILGKTKLQKITENKSLPTETAKTATVKHDEVKIEASESVKLLRTKRETVEKVKVSKKEHIKSKNNKKAAEKFEKNEKKTSKGRKHLSKVKQQENKDSTTTTAKIESN
uniref:Cystatin domain-containing protein n=1 Tax=Strongyloides venezuelensis TaxID=75913 RepID=A0A0K0FIQ6_STRVS